MLVGFEPRQHLLKSSFLRLLNAGIIILSDYGKTYARLV